MASAKTQWNASLARVMDLVMSCNVKFKHAAEVGRRAVVYCRGQDLLKWVEDNKDLLNKKHIDALDKRPIETTEDAIEFCDRLIRFGFLYRAQYKPLDGVIEKGEDGQFRRPKWPKRLAITTKQSFDPQYFYCCVYEGSKNWQYFMLFCVISAVLCVCMFPAWPLKLKIGLWYISVFLLTFILALVVIRLVLYVLFWFAGFQFWFLPNLFNEDAGFVESFQPVLDMKRPPNDWTMFFTRIFCAIITAATIYKLGQTHSAADVANFAQQSLLDVLEWGTMRLSAPYNDSKALPNVAPHEALKETSENSGNEENEDSTMSDDGENYSCIKACGYSSFEDLMASKCLVKCTCMQGIMASECFSSCPDVTRAALEEATGDACREEETRKHKKNARNQS